MTLASDIYERIAEKISDSVDCDRFTGCGEIDVDKDSFVSYEFEGEGQRVDYYAADSITPCQWGMKADVRVTALYVTEGGEESIDISALENYLNNNIQIS